MGWVGVGDGFDLVGESAVNQRLSKHERSGVLRRFHVGEIVEGVCRLSDSLEGSDVQRF